MEGLGLVKRKTLQAAVAALCVEVGFVSADKEAMGTLSEMLQSCELYKQGHLAVHNPPFLFRHYRAGKDFSYVQRIISKNRTYIV